MCLFQVHEHLSFCSLIPRNVDVTVVSSQIPQRCEVAGEGSVASIETTHRDTGAPKSYRPSPPAFRGELQPQSHKAGAEK